jgi:hypothetical protein
MTTAAVQENDQYVPEHEPWQVQGSSSEYATAAHFFDALGQRYEFAFTGNDFVGVVLFNFRIGAISLEQVDQPERYGAYPTNEAEAITWVQSFMDGLKASHEDAGLPTTSEAAADLFAKEAGA